MYQHLEMRSHVFLLLGITNIRGKKSAPPESSFLRRFVQDFLLLRRRIQFAFNSRQKEHMNVTIIISQLTLTRMENNTCQCTQNKNPESPLNMREWDFLIKKTQTNAQIDCKKPRIACKTIQHASPMGFLPRHSCQLPITAVVKVGPHQK